ncbi:MAG: YbhB/YbcL family Raf kinase inhibitor-like protein [Actinomycetota bacterium]
MRPLVRQRVGPIVRWALAATAAVALTACDTGDGTQLRPPDADAAPVTTVPVGTSTAVPVDTLATAPIETPASESASQPAETLALDTIPTTTLLLPAPDEIDLDLTAPWDDGGVIDPRYGCDGLNAAPPLRWGGVPAAAPELAVALVQETDLSRGRPFVHWVVTGLDAGSVGLAENEVPPGAVTALNFFGNVAYDGPCPALGTTGVFRLSLFVLSQPLGVGPGVPAGEILDRIEGITLAERSVTGSMTR